MEKKMPVLLTFDLDGETLWRCRDPENANRPVTLSQGRYGPEEGVPRILRVLDKFGIKSTFFIPGFTVNQYQDLVRKLHQEGHEIGNHGWSHTYPDNLNDYQTEKKEYIDSSNLIEKIVGERPKGYRSPAWEFSVYTGGIIVDEMPELQYSSNMMDTERIRHLVLDGKKTRLVEIPISWVLDDAAFWLYSLRTPGKAIQPLDSVEKYWITEFDSLLEEYNREVGEVGVSDICFVLTCHPQIIGRPSRIKLLERVIEHMAITEQVQFMTCLEAVGNFKKRQKE